MHNFKAEINKPDFNSQKTTVLRHFVYCHNNVFFLLKKKKKKKGQHRRPQFMFCLKVKTDQASFR